MENFGWAKESVENLYSKGIINGKSDSHFAPEDNVKREEFVQMIVKAFNISAEAQINFEDTVSDQWYYTSVASAVGAGIINGVSEKEFGIGKEITRQDAAVIAYRAVKALDSADTETVFSDNSEISDYASEAVKVMAANGIIKGDGGRFEPKRGLTRAEAAVIIDRLLSVIETEDN